MRLESVVFDLDGTLVDSLPGIQYSVDAALQDCGLPPRTDDLRQRIGPPVRNILSSVVGPVEESKLGALERSFRISYDSAGWKHTLLHPGAHQMLYSLHGVGIHTFIATNKPAKPTNLILGELGIAPLFREVVCKDSLEPPYPCKAAMLTSLLDRHALSKRLTLYVGDNREDYDAGLAAGYGGSGLEPHPELILIDRFADLPIEF